MPSYRSYTVDALDGLSCLDDVEITVSDRHQVIGMAKHCDRHTGQSLQHVVEDSVVCTKPSSQMETDTTSVVLSQIDLKAVAMVTVPFIICMFSAHCGRILLMQVKKGH